MSKVGPAGIAEDFGSPHAVTVIGHSPDSSRVYGRKETRPAAAGIKLGVRAEQCRPAANAVVDTIVLTMDIFPGERPFGSLVTADLVLLRRQLCPPFRISFFPLLIRHGQSLMTGVVSVVTTPLMMSAMRPLAVSTNTTEASSSIERS